MEILSLRERMLIEAGFLPFKNSKGDGGPGSGNHGHKGVPGQVGGSAPKESGKNSEVKSKVSIDTIKQNHYTPIEQEALRNPAIAMGVLMASGEVNAQEYVELMQNGKAVDRAKEYIEEKYSALEKRYKSCSDAQKRMMEMTTKEFKEYVDAAYNKEIDSHLNTKSKLQHIIAESGMDMKPKVVGVEEFEKIAAESPSGKMYRGVVGNTKAGATAEDVVNLTVNGEKTFVGDGMHSDGIYFSTVKATADSYAANGGKVMTACVSPDARVIWYNDLMKMKGEHVSDPNLVSMDTGVFALYKGYNCIELEPVSGDRYYIALDRSALVFCDEHSDANEKGTSTIDGTALAETFNAFAQIEENVDGGPGSGNWGHEGRPGEVGGSAEGGGSHNRMGNKKEGFTSFSKNKKQFAKPHKSNAEEYDSCPAGSIVIDSYGKWKKGHDDVEFINIDTGELKYSWELAFDNEGEDVRILVPDDKNPNFKKMSVRDDDRFSAARKNAAFHTSEPADADEVFREQSGRIWKEASDDARNALYNYTGHYYSDINDCLRSGSKPTEKIGKYIQDMTETIDKSELQQDTFLYRGIDRWALSKMLGVDYEAMGKQNPGAYVGKEISDKAFMSCSPAEGKGFDGSGVYMKIYCPAGTKAMYAEPFSKFGNGAKRDWDGESGQTSFSEEFETILQRGTRMQITNMTRDEYNSYIVECQVLAQEYE